MNGDQKTYIEGAIRWALARRGAAEFAFRCNVFARDAYEQGNGIRIAAREWCAREAADLYAARKQPGGPPRGAYVFYDCAGPLHGEQRNWGHIGISLGGGRIVHAWDTVRVDGCRAVEKLTPAAGWTRPAYIGWAPAEEILRGMTSRGE